MTIPLYYESTHKTEAQCKVERVAQDEKGWFMILSHTLFYPQGGGQPADKGYVQVDSHCIPISNVRMMGQEIRYYIERDYPGPVLK
jgi:alanyl-tRNA synthetase